MAYGAKLKIGVWIVYKYQTSNLIEIEEIAMD